jgi:hypothetical protein
MEVDARMLLLGRFSHIWKLLLGRLLDTWAGFCYIEVDSRMAFDVWDLIQRLLVHTWIC